jgi:Tfp pilus assembly protein PilN
VSQQINLFNPVFLKQKKLFSAVTMVQALGLILLGALLLGVYVNLGSSGLAREADATTAQLKAAQSQLAQVSAAYGPRKKSDALESEVKKMEAEIRSMQQVSEILQKGDFGNKNGFAEYLRALSRQVVDGVWLTGFNVQAGGNEIGIHGRALQPELVPAYLNRLKREQVMQGKSFASLEMATPAAPATPGLATSNKPAVPARYVEFSLESSVASRTKVGLPGAGLK